MKNIRLHLEIPSASPAEIDRGLTAAHASLLADGVTAWDAAYGQWKIEGEQWHDITEKHASDSIAWERATNAAIAACCQGWPVQPDGWPLSVTWTSDQENRSPA